MDQGEDRNSDDIAWDNAALPSSPRRKIVWTYVGWACGIIVIWAAVFAATPLFLRLTSLLTISTVSMEPTLKEGSIASFDRLYYLTGNRPARGDIISFKAKGEAKIYAKRIIGLPGDHVQVRHGHVYLNGEVLQRSTPSFVRVVADGGKEEIRKKYSEQLPKGIAYSIYEISDVGPLDDTPEYVVPPGEYFVMGDNRDVAMDSRLMGVIGFVPRANITGRLCETLTGKWL